MSKSQVNENMDKWLDGFTRRTDNQRSEENNFSIKHLPSYELTYRRSKAKNQLFQILFESTDDAVLVLKGDEFIDCNHRTLEVFNCRRDQIIGQTPYRFSPSTQYDGRSSEKLAKEKITTALAGKPSRFEWIHSRHDGEFFNAEVTLNRLDLKGEVYLVAIVREVTENVLPEGFLTAEMSEPATLEQERIDLRKITESLKKGKIFSDPNRLLLMYVLHYNVSMNFTDLQDKLGLTPGNLGHHLKKLEKIGFVRMQKVISWRILTTVSITDEGSIAFKEFASKIKTILCPIG